MLISSSGVLGRYILNTKVLSNRSLILFYFFIKPSLLGYDLYKKLIRSKRLIFGFLLDFILFYYLYIGLHPLFP